MYDDQFKEWRTISPGYRIKANANSDGNSYEWYFTYETDRSSKLDNLIEKQKKEGGQYISCKAQDTYRAKDVVLEFYQPRMSQPITEFLNKK